MNSKKQGFDHVYNQIFIGHKGVIFMVPLLLPNYLDMIKQVLSSKMYTIVKLGVQTMPRSTSEDYKI